MKSKYTFLEIPFLFLVIIMFITCTTLYSCKLFKSRKHCTCNVIDDNEENEEYVCAEWWVDEGENCRDNNKVRGGDHKGKECHSPTCQTSSNSRDNLMITFGVGKIVLASKDNIDASITNNISTEYQSGSCQHEIENATPYAIVISKVDDGLPDSLKELHNVLNSDDHLITKSKVLKIFNQDSDPCNRSDLKVNDGQLLNEGERCYFTTEAIVSQNIVESIEIHIPKKVLGEFQKGEETKIIFHNKNMAPLLKLGQFLDMDYGGTIKEVVSTGNNIIIGTERGCIKLNY